MKNKKLHLLLIALLVTAGAQARAGRRAEMERVQKLADQQINGADVRKTIEIYDNKEGNPCAEAGINYIVKVKVRKSQMKQLPDGSVGQSREWLELNQYVISRADLLAGKKLSDTLCQE